MDLLALCLSDQHCVKSQSYAQTKGKHLKSARNRSQYEKQQIPCVDCFQSTLHHLIIVHVFQTLLRHQDESRGAG